MFKLLRRAGEDMKLAKLPDRTPAKMSIMLTPGLAKRLREYADFYAQTYGSREEVAELIPFMLAAFLDSDAAFKKMRTGGATSSLGNE